MRDRTIIELLLTALNRNGAPKDSATTQFVVDYRTQLYPLASFASKARLYSTLVL